jgi:hypothetical protein
VLEKTYKFNINLFGERSSSFRLFPQRLFYFFFFYSLYLFRMKRKRVCFAKKKEEEKQIQRPAKQLFLYKPSRPASSFARAGGPSPSEAPFPPNTVLGGSCFANGREKLRSFFSQSINVPPLLTIYFIYNLFSKL